MKKHQNLKVFLRTMCMTMAFAAMVTGCGKKGKEKPEETEKASLSFYTTEYVKLPMEDGGDYIGHPMFANGRVYYTDEQYDEGGSRQWLKYISVKGEDKGGFSIDLAEGMNVSAMTVDADNGIYLGIQDSSQITYNEATGERSGEDRYLLQKLDQDGRLLLEKDITGLVKGNADDYAYVQSMCTDAEGNLYLLREQRIILLDGECKDAGEITMEDWVNAIGRGPDGDVYVCWWGNQGGMMMGALDFQKKNTDTARTYSGVPADGNSVWGLDQAGNFLVYDETRLYRYQAGSKEPEVVLDWLDSDISGMNISCVDELEEGKIGAILNSWSEEGSSTELVLLTKAEPGEITEKEIITLGIMFQGGTNQQQIIQFNRDSDKYRIRVKYYIDSNAEWTETTYTDGMKAMSADILSGKGPDLFSVDGLDLSSLSEKGAFEDIYPYLDKGSDLTRDDILPNVLEAYTYDGKLTCIPMSFYIETMAAKTSLVGDRKGWTMDDVIALTDANPDADVIQYASKSMMLQYLLQNSVAEFVDNETGTCNFHDPEFVKLLDYINRFPQEMDYEAEREESFISKIRDNRLLLHNVNLAQPEGISETVQIFGDEPISFIGYPTVDGENGTFLNANGLYAISSKSPHKDGAWDFLHTILTADNTDTDRYYYGFPIRKESLEAMLAKSQEDMYVLDEEGKVVLDDEGNPVKQSRGGMSIDGSDMIERYAPTDEELDLVRELIQRARPRNQMDMQIMNMIMEECEPFFLGQKNGDAVADIIQSRVQLYISENR